MDASEMTVRKLHMLADKLHKKRQTTRKVAKNELWTAQEPIGLFKSRIKHIHRPERILQINFSANLLASSNECKEFAVQVPLQSCCVKTWTYGHVSQNWCRVGKHLGISPGCTYQYLQPQGNLYPLGWPQPHANASWGWRWRSWQQVVHR